MPVGVVASSTLLDNHDAVNALRKSLASMVGVEVVIVPCNGKRLPQQQLELVCGRQFEKDMPLEYTVKIWNRDEEFITASMLR